MKDDNTPEFAHQHALKWVLEGSDAVFPFHLFDLVMYVRVQLCYMTAMCGVVHVCIHGTRDSSLIKLMWRVQYCHSKTVAWLRSPAG